VTGLNQPVRDGKFEFRITSVETQGQYVVVYMLVDNIGNEAQSFFPNNQKLIDTQGRRYDADTSEALRLNNDFETDLNPGIRAGFLVPFVVPPKTPLSAVELHDSAFSSGARVNLA
jgi:hypothetical protein